MSRVCRRSRAGSAPRWRRQARSTAGRPRPMRRIRPCPPSRPAGAQPGLQRRWHRGLHAARLDRRRRRRRAGQHAARPHVVPGDRGAASVRLGSAPGRRRVFRSEDQGLRWSYDAQVALGAPERRALFLSETRAVALESRDGGERLLYTEDGARRWQAATIMEQVWPDAGAYGKAFDAQAERTRGLGQADRLEYRWSLYPLGETQAVGWSWRVRVQTGAQAPQLIETRRFEIAFQDGAPPAFRIQQAAAPRRSRTRQAHPVLTPAARAAPGVGRPDLSAGPGVREWHGVAAAPCCGACPVVSAGPGSGARAGWCWPAPSCCSRPTAAPAPISIPVTRAATGGRSSCRPARKRIARP